MAAVYHRLLRCWQDGHQCSSEVHVLRAKQQEVLMAECPAVPLRSTSLMLAHHTLYSLGFRSRK